MHQHRHLGQRKLIKVACGTMSVVLEKKLNILITFALHFL